MAEDPAGERERTTPRSPWIVGPTVDGVFILGLPLLSLIAIHLAAAQWSARSIWAAVMTFGAIGHHLPGFIRTYGDRELFARHRARLVIAPVVVFGSTLWFARHNLHGVLLIALVWAIWHGMMQHYGFMRIYAAKAGDTGDRRLDFWMTVTWFGLCLTLSPHQKASVLDGLYASGWQIVSKETLELIEHAAILATVVITAVYLRSLWRRRQRGRPAAPLKLILLVSTTALVYVARVQTSDPFLSVAMFEVMHDVQYLAIVWAFNRRRVEQSGPLTALMFRPGVARIGVYVGLCLLYGSVGYFVNERMDPSSSQELLVAALTTSGILHFYYDGFIWKLGRPDTRVGLDLAGDRDNSITRSERRRDLAHLAAFGLPLLILARMEGRGTESELAQASAIVAAAPDDVTAQQNAGAALMAEGRVAEALPHLQRAVTLRPDLPEARRRLARALVALERGDEAFVHAEAALVIEPDDAGTLHLMGSQRIRRGELDAAIAELTRAAELGLDSAPLNNDLGYALLNVRRFDEAESRLQRAVLLDPTHAGAFLNLGLLYGSMRKLEAAHAALTRAVQLKPEFTDAHNNLGGVLMMLGRRDEAIAHFHRALEIDPSFEPARHNLERATRP